MEMEINKELKEEESKQRTALILNGDGNKQRVKREESKTANTFNLNVDGKKSSF